MVKTFPVVALLSPIFWRILASAAVIDPNCAWPSARGGATAGTVMSWIIHPSYQPLSLLMRFVARINSRAQSAPRSDILREANVLRPAKLEHAVQRGGSNGHLGRLPAS